MSKTNKPIKIEFAPGCFDDFDGTQEELDEFIKEITRMAENGELEENSRALDLDDPDEDTIEAVARLLDYELQQAQKKLQ